jgi:hypothetical protein
MEFRWFFTTEALFNETPTEREKRKQLARDYNTGVVECDEPGKTKRDIDPPKNVIVEDNTLQRHIDRWGVINAKDNLDREIYTTLLQEDNKYSRYSRSQVKKYVMDYSDYSEWIWDNKINRMCPEPFSFHIKTGSFIADEMRGQVVGLWREKTKDGWSSLAVMTKWEWRYMDEDSLQTYKEGINSLYGRPSEEREYYIINTEQMEADIDGVFYCNRCGQDTDEIHHGYCSLCHHYIAQECVDDDETVPDETDEYIIHRMELQAEIEADIARGK